MAGVPDVRVSVFDVVGDGLDDEEMFVPGGQTFPYGADAAVVEVILETGEVRILKLVAVDDCGVVLNPMIVEGQVEGSLTQGLGQAILEEVRYDVGGQPLTATMMDYLLAAGGVTSPQAITDRKETPAPSNPLGAKGSGEAGCIGAPAGGAQRRPRCTRTLRGDRAADTTPPRAGVAGHSGGFVGDEQIVVKGAAVQAAPVFLDREATLDKAVGLIEEAGANGAQIVGFPEGFIPAHPIWFHFGSGTDRAATGLSVELFKNSVEVPGPEIDALCAPPTRSRHLRGHGCVREATRHVRHRCTTPRCSSAPTADTSASTRN